MMLYGSSCSKRWCETVIANEFRGLFISNLCASHNLLKTLVELKEGSIVVSSFIFSIVLLFEEMLDELKEGSVVVSSFQFSRVV